MLKFVPDLLRSAFLHPLSTQLFGITGDVSRHGFTASPKAISKCTWGPSLLYFSTITVLKIRTVINYISTEYMEIGLEVCGEMWLIFINLSKLANLFL